MISFRGISKSGGGGGVLLTIDGNLLLSTTGEGTDVEIGLWEVSNMLSDQGLVGNALPK